MPRARDNGKTHPETQPPATPDNERMARALAPLPDDIEHWNDRDPASKAMRAAQGAAERLGGLAEICWGLAFAECASRRMGRRRL